MIQTLPKVDYYDQTMDDERMHLIINPSENQRSIHNCMTCSLSEYCKPLSFENVGAELMVIGHMPSDVMDDNMNGNVLRSLIHEDFGIPANKVYYTSVVKCKDATTMEHAQACHHHLVAEILYNRPLVIIALGYLAAQPFLESVAQQDLNNPSRTLVPGYAAQISPYSGMIVTNTIQDVLPNKQLQDELVEHFKYALQFIQQRKE